MIHSKTIRQVIVQRGTAEYVADSTDEISVLEPIGDRNKNPVLTANTRYEVPEPVEGQPGKMRYRLSWEYEIWADEWPGTVDAVFVKLPDNE